MLMLVDRDKHAVLRDVESVPAIRRTLPGDDKKPAEPKSRAKIKSPESYRAGWAKPERV
jgi:hypothetical protein